MPRPPGRGRSLPGEDWPRGAVPGSGARGLPGRRRVSATRRVVRLGPRAISTRRPEAARSPTTCGTSASATPESRASERSVQGERPAEAERGGDPRRRLGIGQPPQPCDRRGIAAADASSHRLDHETTPERGRRALARGGRTVGHGPPPRPRRERAGPARATRPASSFDLQQKSQSGADLRGADVEAVARPVAERPRSPRAGLICDREDAGGREVAGRRQLVSPANLVVVHSDEVERRARAAADPLHPSIVPLDAPDANGLCPRGATPARRRPPPGPRRPIPSRPSRARRRRTTGRSASGTAPGRSGSGPSRRAAETLLESGDPLARSRSKS